MNSQVQTIGKTASTIKLSQSWLDASLKFLSSVKFGIAVMIALAVVIILGTLIAQAPMAEPGQIEQLYAPQTRQILGGLGLFDVFHSSWFIALLGLLCLNITFASIDRFPGTWEYLRRPQRELNEESIEALPLNVVYSLKSGRLQLEEEVRGLLQSSGFQTSQSSPAGRTVIFGEKGKYSRLAVYIVHASLLLIFLGAMIDSIFGFRAYLSLTEGESSNQVEVRGKNSVVQLPFQIRCNAAGVEHYADGTPKKWWSDLVIVQNGQEVGSKRILVNDPMDYGGIRIFQSSFGSSGNPLEFVLALKDQSGSAPLSVTLHPGETLPLKGNDLSLRALQFIPDFAMHGSEIHSHSNEPNNPALQVEVTESGGSQWKIWVFQKMPDFHAAEAMPYHLRFESVRMSHFTGLQIAKQPGQNIIWAGCFLMVAGLLVSFYFSHQRVWALVRVNEKGESVLRLGGSANKNKLDFEKKFRVLEQSLSLGSRR
jgi:cytochrome c biogenesis protein